jgi:hypothetical protein
MSDNDECPKLDPMDVTKYLYYHYKLNDGLTTEERATNHLAALDKSLGPLGPKPTLAKAVLRLEALYADLRAELNNGPAEHDEGSWTVMEALRKTLEELAEKSDAHYGMCNPGEKKDA